MSDILTASITASRNPVTTNVPDLSTSDLTCHTEGLLPEPKVDITNFFDRGVCTIEGLVIDPNSHLPKIVTHAYHGTTWANTTGCYIMDFCELEVIDNTIIKRTSNHTTSGYTITGNSSDNISTSGYITNIDCKVEELSEGINTIIGGDNATYDNAYLYAGVAIKGIGNNKYRIYVYDTGNFYSEIYEYNPFEWHTYTICHNAYHGTLYLFIDNNFILSVKKFHNRAGNFCLYLGNPNQSTNSRPLFTNTVLFKNIKEYYFYKTYAEVMNSILYFNSKYIEHDWGEVDFSVFPPRLLCTDGNILAPTTDEVGGYGGSVFVDDSGDNVFKVKELYCADYNQTHSIFLSRVENNTGICIEYDFKVSKLSTLTSPNTKNSCALYTTSSRTYYYTMSLYLHLLDNGKYFISTSNNDITPEDSYCHSEELDIDFSDWVHVEVFQVYINYLSSVKYLKINGVLIPFTGSGANEDGASKEGYTYWYYSFSSYTNWYGNEEICLKNFKLKTLTLNPDYEEYPELTYLWNTGETTKQITVQPTEPTEYNCTVTQGTRTTNASILIDTILRINELPVAKINADNVITIPKGPVAIIKANGGIYG